MAEELARYRIATLDGLPPFAGGCRGDVRLRPCAQRRAERRRAEPGRHRDAGAGRDGHRRPARVRPPAPRGHGARERDRRGRCGTGLPAGRHRDRGRARTPARAGPAGGHGPHRPADLQLEPGLRRLRGGRRAREGVHPRGRRLPGGPEPALERRLPGGRLLDLPRPARDQPEPVHVLPRLRGLRDRRGVTGGARDRDGPERSAAPDRGHAPARATPSSRTSSAGGSCSPTRRSAPST